MVGRSEKMFQAAEKATTRARGRRQEEGEREREGAREKEKSEDAIIMGLAVAVAVAEAEAEAVSRVWEQPQLSADGQVLQAAGGSVGRVVGSVESMEAWKRRA